MQVQNVKQLNSTEQASKRSNVKKWGSIFIVLLLIILSIIFFWPRKNNFDKADFSDVSKICELATLRCYYHDVAEYEKQPDGLFQYGIFQYGYKKFWIEYDGIIEVGIDVSKVKVKEPDKNGVIQIYVPKAEILNVNADLNSMGNWISETGIFTNITTEEKAKAFSKAQETMRINAENDNNILLQAHNNAKELVKQYVINVGKNMKQEFTVEWIEDPNN